MLDLCGDADAVRRAVRPRSPLGLRCCPPNLACIWHAERREKSRRRGNSLEPVDDDAHVATWALIFAAIGTLLGLAAALWLLLGSNPNSERYRDDGPLYPGRQRSKVGPVIVREQRQIAGLVTAGSTFQVTAAILALLA